MIKFINSPNKIVEEMVIGYKYANQDFIDVLPNNKAIVLKKKGDKVSIIIGGGGGNEPWCLGYVGHGLADGAALGNVYTSPPAKSILNITEQVYNEKGVLYIGTNHAGDVLNFGLVSELAELSGIRTKTIFISDDISTAPIEQKEDRRGVAGIGIAVKIAGAASENGLSLDDVYEVVKKTNRNLHTLSVTSSPGFMPSDGETMFELKEGFIEFGMGFNGEPGVVSTKFESAEKTIDILTENLTADIENKNGEIAVLLNGFGFTSILELCILNKRLKENFDMAKINIYDMKIENWFCPQGTGGFSVSILELDDELKKYYDHPAYSPLYKSIKKAGDLLW